MPSVLQAVILPKLLIRAESQSTAAGLHPAVLPDRLYGERISPMHGL
jgi:hypothetical protein